MWSDAFVEVIEYGDAFVVEMIEYSNHGVCPKLTQNEHESIAHTESNGREWQLQPVHIDRPSVN